MSSESEWTETSLATAIPMLTRAAAEIGDEILLRIVRQPIVQERNDCHDPNGRNQQGVSIVPDNERLHTGSPVAARAIVDHDGTLPPLRQERRVEPSREIDTAACRVGHDQADRPGGPRIRTGRLRAGADGDRKDGTRRCHEPGSCRAHGHRSNLSRDCSLRPHHVSS